MTEFVPNAMSIALAEALVTKHRVGGYGKSDFSDRLFLRQNGAAIAAVTRAPRIRVGSSRTPYADRQIVARLEKQS